MKKSTVIAQCLVRNRAADSVEEAEKNRETPFCQRVFCVGLQ